MSDTAQGKESDPEREALQKQEQQPSTSDSPAAVEATAAAEPPAAASTSVKDQKPEVAVVVAADATAGKKQSKGSVQIQEPPVSATHGYSIVKVEEKHGPFYRAIPAMPLPLAIICCILNILVPGLGTLISAFTVFCCGPSQINKPCQAFGLNLLSALLQMITFIVIVGWIWSILWGMTFVQLSHSHHKPKKHIHQIYGF